MTIASSKLIRCSYPNCVLEEHLEGEHKLGRPDKPWGTLRQLQRFDAVLTSGGCVRCDYCTSGRLILRDDSKPPVWRAVGFYADMLGFGWALCAECARRFAAEPLAISTQQSAKATEPAVAIPPCASVPSVVNLPTKVLKFEPRANSQKLKAGVS